jgi:hypothetical protein
MANRYLCDRPGRDRLSAAGAGGGTQLSAALDYLRARIALSEPKAPILAALAAFQAELLTDTDLPLDHPEAIRLRLRLRRLLRG